MIRNAANPVSLNLDATVIAKLTLPISRVLVLEDNFLIALDAEDMLKNLGIPKWKLPSTSRRRRR